MLEPKDKRTKEYKEWKKLQEENTSEPMEGLGDLVEKVTEATGIKAVVKSLFGDDCGCDERKKKLNEMFRFRYRVECLTEDEYTILDEFFSKNPTTALPSEYSKLRVIAMRVFNMRIDKGSGCNSCKAEIINKLKKVYENYEQEK